MEFIIWLVIGGLAGWIGTLLMKKDAAYGILANILLGIVGAYVGGIIFSLLGIGGGSIVGFIAAVIGAMILIWIVSKFKKA